jgi:hypothetical protein
MAVFLSRTNGEMALRTTLCGGRTSVTRNHGRRTGRAPSTHPGASGKTVHRGVVATLHHPVQARTEYANPGAGFKHSDRLLTFRSDAGDGPDVEGVPDTLGGGVGSEADS